MKLDELTSFSFLCKYLSVTWGIAFAIIILGQVALWWVGLYDHSFGIKRKPK